MNDNREFANRSGNCKAVTANLATALRLGKPKTENKAIGAVVIDISQRKTRLVWLVVPNRSAMTNPTISMPAWLPERERRRSATTPRAHSPITGGKADGTGTKDTGSAWHGQRISMTRSSPVILIVEDEFLLRWDFAEAIESGGFEVDLGSQCRRGHRYLENASRYPRGLHRYPNAGIDGRAEAGAVCSEQVAADQDRCDLRPGHGQRG